MTAIETNASLGPEPPDHDRLYVLVRKINDKSVPWAERDAAKNELLLSHVGFIWDKVSDRTGGRVGISDRQTELLDSAFAYLKANASNIAQAVENEGVFLLKAIAERIMGWGVDKIRRSDGQTKKRGKDFKRQPVTVLHDQDDAALSPSEDMIRDELHARIKAAVFETAAELTAEEQTVVLSHFGFGGPELSMREIADLLGVTLYKANRIRESSQDKLRKWLADHDPNN